MHRSRLIGIPVAVFVAGVLAGVVVTGSVAAANNTTTTNTTLYNDSYEVNNGWMDGRGNVTLDNVASLLADIGPYLIGTGGGAGAVGALMTGFLVAGVVVSIIGGSAVGAVTGAVMGTLTIGALVQLELAPDWLWALVLAAIGIIATAVILRALQ